MMLNELLNNAVYILHSRQLLVPVRTHKRLYLHVVALLAALLFILKLRLLLLLNGPLLLQKGII